MIPAVLAVFSVLLARVACATPATPTYPQRYTVGMTLHPGGYVLEAYDFADKHQLFWFAEGARTLLNRFDLAASYEFDASSCDVSKLDGAGMQTPDFLKSFTFEGNVTVDSPNFPAPVPCYEWRDPSPPVVVVYTAVKNGDPVKLTVGSPVTRYNFYEPLHQVVSFNPGIFDVPKVCSNPAA